MSKKSRKRNKKILGALAAGLGAMALMRGRQGTASNNPVGGVDQIAADAVTGTKYPGANKALAAPVDKTIYGGGIHRGKPPKGDIVKRMRINAINTAEGSPMIDNPYRAPVQPKGRLWTRSSSYKSGGRVKGCGVAKRGLGRAMKKGRK